uniref:Hypothetical secreted protein n=1 Tax=Simulium vittatum TaxID=7192 RepID=B5M0P8_SIMVI|nr:hypothetical secreted protein [Simulium vittatum]
MHYFTFVKYIAALCLLLLFLGSAECTPLGPPIRIPAVSSVAKNSATNVGLASKNVARKNMTPKQLRLARLSNHPKAKLHRSDAIRLPERPQEIVKRFNTM